MCGGMSTSPAVCVCVRGALTVYILPLLHAFPTPAPSVSLKHLPGIQGTSCQVQPAKAPQDHKVDTMTPPCVCVPPSVSCLYPSNVTDCTTNNNYTTFMSHAGYHYHLVVLLFAIDDIKAACMHQGSGGCLPKVIEDRMQSPHTWSCSTDK